MNAQINRIALANSMLGLFIGGLSARIFLISLPTVAVALGTDMLGVSWALIAYQVAGIGLGVVLGRLGDIYSRQRIYGLGLIIMTAGSFLCGISRSVFQLTVFRFLQGIAGSIIQSSGRALGLEAVPDGRAGKAQGLMVMSHQFGFLLGPPLGGLIIELAGWRWVFFLVVPVGVIGIALTYIMGKHRPPESAGRPRQPVDYKGASLFLLLALLSAFLLDQKTAMFSGLANKSVFAVVLVTVLWRFLHHELRTESPILDLAIFRNRLFSYGATGLLGICITQGLSNFVMPFYLQDILYLSPSLMGILFLIPSVCNLVLAPVSGQISDKIGPRVPLVIGVSFSLVALFIGTRFGPHSHWLVPASLLGFSGMATAFFNAPSQATMVTSLPKNQWGVGTGIIHSIFGLGHLLGISLTGVVLTLAFQHYLGMSGVEPGPEHPAAFVSSINAAFLVAMGVGLMSLYTSVIGTSRGPHKS